MNVSSSLNGCVLVLLIGQIQPAYLYNNGHLEARSLIRDFTVTKRFRRSILKFGIGSVFKGITATTKLLKGSTPLLYPYAPNARRTTHYVKPGNFEDAVADFLSVQPTNVRNYELTTGVKGKTGTIGNRIIKVETEAGSTRGTIQILDDGTRDKKPLKTIIYTEIPKYRKYTDQVLD